MMRFCLLAERRTLVQQKTEYAIQKQPTSLYTFDADVGEITQLRAHTVLEPGAVFNAKWRAYKFMC